MEDAAQAIDSFYKGKPLGGIGHFGCFSFHETKNVTAGGEGGLLMVNNERFIRRAEIIWEKGTNRAEFFRGMVNKYGWVVTAYAIFFGSLLINIWAMSKELQLKEFAILEALGYIFVPLLSSIVLKEHVSFRTILGSGIIIIGLVVFYL